MWIGDLEGVERERIKEKEKPMLSDDECGGVVAVICRYTYSELISMQFSHSAVRFTPKARTTDPHIHIM